MNHKSTAYLITAAIAVIALIVMTSVNIKTKKNLKSEQLALKTLSVEKAAIEKELRNANVKFSGLQSEFDINTGRLKESAIKLDETEKADQLTRFGEQITSGHREGTCRAEKDQNSTRE
jgi:hypothetical protein